MRVPSTSIKKLSGTTRSIPKCVHYYTLTIGKHSNVKTQYYTWQCTMTCPPLLYGNPITVICLCFLHITMQRANGIVAVWAFISDIKNKHEVHNMTTAIFVHETHDWPLRRPAEPKRTKPLLSTCNEVVTKNYNLWTSQFSVAWKPEEL